jgi:3-methyladenine DNA glycosylase AlkD
VPPRLRPAPAVRRLHAEIAEAFGGAAGRRAGAETRESRFHRGPVVAYGLRADDVRAVMKPWLRKLGALSLDERFALAGLLLASRIEEEGHAAMEALRTCLDEINPRHFARLDALLDDFTSWSITDDFASGRTSITAALLARYPKETLRLLRAWVTSPNHWKRRAALVTFTRQVAAEGRFVDETLRFCAALQRDPEDLVQKAVGWALKDTMRAGPEAKRRVLALVRRMRRDGIAATITLYAVRDLKGAERAAVLRAQAGS